MKTKRILVFLLSLLMVLTMGVTAFAAAGDTTGTGSVTINGALEGNTFTLYKIFDLESHNAATGTYAYTIDTNSLLYATIKDMKLQVGTMSSAKPVFTLSDKADSTTIEYVQLTPDFSNTQDNSEVVKAIAAKLIEKIDTLTDEQKATLSMRQIKNLGVSGEADASKNETKLPAANAADITTAPVEGEGNENKSNIKFSNLDLGYYLVDSTAGTMLGLTTTNPNGTITAKNELPNVVKEVKRNVDGVWSDGNAKKIGETVEYRVQVGVEEGATNYVIHDSMSEGLTFKEITKVYYGDPNNLQNDKHLIYQKADGTNAGKGDIGSAAMNEFFKYTKATETAPITYDGKDCCFEMKFEDKLLNQVLTDQHKDDQGYNKVIYVEYTAVLNEKAVIGDYPASAGNPNDVYLTYGENDVEVGHDTVRTMTYEMELVKTKDDKTVLEGAQFEVYDTEADALAGTNKMHFVKDTTGEKTIYKVATQEQIDAGTTVTTIDAGDVIIQGLGGNFKTGAQDEGRTYYFKETKAPAGYTLLPTPEVIRIGKTDNMATVESGKWVSGGLRIINNSGTLMPSTGGIGTTIFYLVGGVLLVGATVLLVTKKRMSAERESK